MELKGKTVNFLGDSITEGVGVEDQTKRYDVRLSKLWELKKANNYGISGTRFAHQHVPYDPASFDLNFCGRSLYMDKEADLIIVFGATNDFGHGDAAFGSDGQTTPATYCGAVYCLMNNLKITYPEAKVVFITPAKRADGPDCSVANSRPLIDYVNKIKQYAPDFGFYVLDFYNDLPIDPHDTAQREKYAPDGLHFNDEGHAILADTIADFVEKI